MKLTNKESHIHINKSKKSNVSAEKDIYQKSTKKPENIPALSPLINPIDAVKIISRLGATPPKSSDLNTVVCKIKDASTNMKLTIMRLNFIF